MVFGGDFRQTLPVVPAGSRQEVVGKSLCRSPLWAKLKFRHLQQNMRLGRSPEDDQHAAWLLDIGAGRTLDNNDMVEVPRNMICDTIDTLIARVYPNIDDPQLRPPTYFLDRTILCPRNDEVDTLNDTILDMFRPLGPNDTHLLMSRDSVSEEDGMHHMYPVEYLQGLSASGIPPSKLRLKIGSPVMLLRNLSPANGLCNGTRMVVRHISRRLLTCSIISKDANFNGKEVFIPRITLSPSAETLPIPLKRHQFPVRLCFAMTVNKSQGQSVDNVGINLETSVFSHGQLYVAFSRCTSPLRISVLLPEQAQESRRTMNVVYQEVFRGGLL